MFYIEKAPSPSRNRPALHARPYRTERRTENSHTAQLARLPFKFYLHISNSAVLLDPHTHTRQVFAEKLQETRGWIEKKYPTTTKYPRAKKNERVKRERTKNIFSRCTSKHKNCATPTHPSRGKAPSLRLLFKETFNR